MIEEGMEAEDLRILMLSTEKTGNTWLKHLLSNIYDLVMPYLGPDFSEGEMERLGRAWVTHQHFFAERAPLEWADANGTRLVTMIRHPADILVSLYHYCCNYAELYERDFRIIRAMDLDAEAPRAAANSPNHIVDGELIRALQDRLIADLNISISWIVSEQAIVMTYEDLRTDPLSTLGKLCSLIRPVTEERIARAITSCELNVLRKKTDVHSKFFRRGLTGEWRSELPKDVIRTFRDEEPFKSQFAFLGYDLNYDIPVEQPARLFSRGLNLQPAESCFDNGVPFVPVLGQILASADPARREHWGAAVNTSSPGTFFDWLNAPADDDVSGKNAIPRITNLAAFIHAQRPDLQAEFPDIFVFNRPSYAGWFLRHAAEEYQLDRVFLTPVALSWLRPKGPLTA